MAETKLHLGCGTKSLSGWVNVDAVADCKPDLLHDLRQPLPFDDLSVSEILAQDLLEHFDKYSRYLVFFDWARVLQMGGVIRLQVPDFQHMLKKRRKLGDANFIDVLFGENMWQSEIYTGHYGNHKWAYTSKSLSEFVEIFGIQTVECERIGMNLSWIGEKVTHVKWQDIQSLQVYSHANHCGDGRDSVSLEEVQIKMSNFSAKQVA